VRRQVQISFLSIFLSLLTVAFATALVVRVRAYSVRAPGSTGLTETGQVSVASGTFGARRGNDLMPLDGVTTSSAVSQPARASSSSTPAMTRAQRFRELLALGAPKAATPAPAAPQTKPTAPPPAPVKPQSTIAKLLQPIVNAFSSKPGGAMAASAPQPQPGTKPNTTTDPRDPNSDTVPPQLLSLNFDPPTVEDGGDTTLIITASDDLSGIRGISGTLASPNGKAVQGFAQQRDGDSMRYISRIHIPEKAEEGIWKVSFLTLSDMATNTATLSFAQGTLPPTAVLRVTSSASDSTPPTLRSVWLDRKIMRAGEHNTLFVDAQDDKSGVHLVAAVFLSPSKLARFGVGCQKGGNDIWQCDILPAQCLDCGDWTLEQVQLLDNANNSVAVRAGPENASTAAVAAVRLNISGDSCDNTPPVLQNLQLNRTEIFIGRDEPVIQITAQVSDDACGTGGVSAQIVGPTSGSSGTYFSFLPAEGNTFIGTVRLDPHSARGVWRVQSVTVTDKGQNLKMYYANDPLLARATFTVK